MGDRIQIGGERGDVFDITPVGTKVLEIGSGTDEASWVRGRQYTGAIVSISNKAVFSEPVSNSSTGFDYLWEEFVLPIPCNADWQRAERILRDEAERVSSPAGARRAVEEVRRRYPVPRAGVEPRVFVRATDNCVESARFVVPVRGSRAVKDDRTPAVLARLAEAGIEVRMSRIP